MGRNKNAGKKMPEKNLPPDWIVTMMAVLSTAFTGVLGALFRQIADPRKRWLERISEWIAGGAMAVVASPIVAEILYYTLLKWDLISPDAGLRPANILGLAGFLCGAVGVSAMEIAITWLRKRFGIPPYRKQ